MGNVYTDIDYANWYAFGEGYLQIGRPIRGHEHLGAVCYVSTHKGFLSWFATEQSCPGDGASESRCHSVQSYGSCKHCGLVVAPEPAYTYGFMPDEKLDGSLTCDVAPYDVKRHGPCGGITLQEAMDAAQAFLADWKASYGDGPYYAIYQQIGENDGIVIESIPNWVEPTEDPAGEGFYAWAGPFTDLQHALHARILYFKSKYGSNIDKVCAQIALSNLPAQWRSFDHKSKPPTEETAAQPSQTIPEEETIPF